MEKIKNLPVFRMLAFAVALALILGICSVFMRVTASADNVTSDDIPSSITGTFGNYNAVKFTASNQTFDPSTVFTEFDTKSYIGVFVYEKNGKLTVYDDLFSYVFNGSMFLEFANSSFNSPDNTMFYILKTDRFKDSSSEQAVYFNNYVMLSADKSKFNYSDLEANIPLNVFPIRTVTFDSFSDLYLIFTTTSGILSKSECIKQISDMTADLDKMSVSQWQEIPEGGSENGRFICFGDYKDYSYDEHLVDISNGCIHQLKDYDNKVKSYYTSFMFDSDDAAYSWVNKRSDENKIKTYKSKAIAFRFYNPDDSISSVRLRISRTMIMPTTRESNNPFDVPAFVTFHPANKHYSRYVVLSEGSLSSVPAKSTITARVDLQAYCDLYGNSTYLLELVNGKSNEVVSSVLMSYTGKDYDRFDSSGVNDANAGYIDVKYQFDKGNTVDNDVLIPDSDGVLPSLPNGVDDDTFKPSGNYDLSNVDITDIFATLNQSTASVGAFFQACFNILPATLVALILGSLALLIVLRVLGR